MPLRFFFFFFLRYFSWGKRMDRSPRIQEACLLAPLLLFTNAFSCLNLSSQIHMLGSGPSVVLSSHGSSQAQRPRLCRILPWSMPKHGGAGRALLSQVPVVAANSPEMVSQAESRCAHGSPT